MQYQYFEDADTPVVRLAKLGNPKWVVCLLDVGLSSIHLEEYKQDVSFHPPNEEGSYKKKNHRPELNRRPFASFYLFILHLISSYLIIYPPTYLSTNLPI